MNLNSDPLRSSRPIRVLIVDDSAIVRRLISDALRDAQDIEVVGTAPDPFVARDKILEFEPDVITLDIEMPRMDGLSFLKRLMHYRPMPVLIISSLGQSGCEASLQALRLGAVDVLAKPAGPNSVGELASRLPMAIRAAANARSAVRLPQTTREQRVPTERQTVTGAVSLGAPRRHLVAIGSSTGGTQAIEAILAGFGSDCPPIVIAQHIPAGFSQAFARRLNAALPLTVREAEDGDLALPGQVLIAPGNFHMVLERAASSEASAAGARYRVAIKDGPLVCYQRPSVDVLFASVARVAGADGVAVVLTGMGNDGAHGIQQIHAARGWTMAQSESTCVVYGMPREAVATGAVDEVVHLGDMAAAIVAAVRRPVRATQETPIASSARISPQDSSVASDTHL
jgi:two-component system chemotaxis response regulator CheB